jgi:hypothetical protein
MRYELTEDEWTAIKPARQLTTAGSKTISIASACPEKVEACRRRLSRALAQRSGSIEDQPFGAGIIVVAEIALALELQRLAVGIGGGCALDEAAA